MSLKLLNGPICLKCYRDKTKQQQKKLRENKKTSDTSYNKFSMPWAVYMFFGWDRFRLCSPCEAKDNRTDLGWGKMEENSQTFWAIILYFLRKFPKLVFLTMFYNTWVWSMLAHWSVKSCLCILVCICVCH